MRIQQTFFLLAGFVSYLFEKQTKSRCNETLFTRAISLFHNYGSIYLVFGSLLFGHHLVHLCSLIITVSLWCVDKDGMCPITAYYNNLCNISPKRPFHDVFYLMNQYLKFPYFKVIIALLAAFYDVQSIWKN